MTLLEPFVRARRDIWSPAGKRILWRSLALTVATFVLLAIAVQVGIGRFSGELGGWIETALEVLGGLATIAVVWLLFPAVATMIAGSMLEGLVEAVEAKHYPEALAHTRASWLSGVVHGARFGLLAIALNLLLLPAYVVLLFIPPLAPVAFVAVNGYLLGREYYDMVATRHLDADAATSLRKAHGGRLFLTGVIIAALFTVPVVNLVAPILGAAAMVHLFHGWRVA